MLLQFMSFPVIVSVEEGEQISSCLLDAEISRGGSSSILLANQPYRRGIRRDRRLQFVGTAIVDH